MDQNVMRTEIKDLLERANPDAIIPDEKADLFDPDCRISPRDMLFACMELKKRYPIDYNQVVDRLDLYSLENLASVICEQLV